MTLLFGMVSLQGEPVPEGVLRRVEEQCDWPRDRMLRLETADAALLALQRDTVPRVGEPRIRRAGDTALLFAGRLDNRQALAARFGCGSEAELSDEDLIHAAWRADGPDFCRRLIGDFAIALHDRRAGRLVLARDHFGGCRCTTRASAPSSPSPAASKPCGTCPAWIGPGTSAGLRRPSRA